MSPFFLQLNIMLAEAIPSFVYFGPRDLFYFTPTNSHPEINRGNFFHTNTRDFV